MWNKGRSCQMSVLIPAARILHFALKARNIQHWTDSHDTHFISSSTSSLTVVTPCMFPFLFTVSDLLSSWKMLPGQPSWHHLILLLRTYDKMLSLLYHSGSSVLQWLLMYSSFFVLLSLVYLGLQTFFLSVETISTPLSLTHSLPMHSHNRMRFCESWFLLCPYLSSSPHPPHDPGPALTYYATAFPGSPYMDIAVWGVFSLQVIVTAQHHLCCSVNSLWFP